MAGVTFKIEDSEFRRRIANLKRGVEDASPLMKNWAEIAQASISSNFETGGRPKWKKLSPVTIALKAKRGGSDPERVLFFKGFLRGGIAYKAETKRVVIGTSPNTRDYAAIQQFGGQAGRGRKVTIPARPYLVLQAGDKQEMTEQMRKFFVKIGS